MFYLLEDNRIIDSNTLFTKNIPLWEIKDNLLFARSKNGKLIKPYKYNAIKKQSENVFDLIEAGDLLKISQEKNYVFEQYKEPEITNYASYIKEAYPKKILAIYKPDYKGKYIKVWERKEENE